jgi:hypothetical protein
MAHNGNPGSELTTRQRRGIAALLTEPDVKAAAQAAGVGYRTLMRWLAELPEFRAALTQAEGETIDAAGRRLLAGQDSALNVLAEIMDNHDNRPGDRRQAAAAWLDFALRWRELRNVEQRLTELESAVYAQPNQAIR